MQHQQKYQLTLKYRVHQSFIDELKCSNEILAYAQCLVFRGKIQTNMQLRFDNL